MPERAVDSNKRSFSRRDLLTLTALTAVSATACFFDLGSRSLWYDEFISALTAAHHGTNLWSAVTSLGGHMMFYYLLLHVFVSLFGGGQFALRAPSAIAGVALTPVIYLLARRMFGTRAAVIASAIVAVSPALVLWDQQARGYCLGTLLIAGSLLALLRAVECPTWGRWCVYGFLSVLSIYTLAYAAMFLFAQWIPLAFWPEARHRPRPVLTVIGVIALAYVSLTALMLRTGAATQLSNNGRPSVSVALKILEELGSAVAPDFSATTLIARVVTAVALLCWIAASAELLSRVRGAPGEFETVCLGITLSWFFAPLFLDTIFSLAYHSLFEPVYLIQSVPAAAILVAFVFGKLLPRGLSYLLAAGFVALLVAALVPTYGISFEQWAQVSRYIRTSSQAGDCLTVNKPFLASEMAYYFSIEGATGEPRLVQPARRWSDALDPLFPVPVSVQRFSTIASQCGRLWIVMNRVSPGQFVLVNSEVTWFDAHGFTHVSVSHFTPRHGFGINLVLLAR